MAYQACRVWHPGNQVYRHPRGNLAVLLHDRWNSRDGSEMRPSSTIKGYQTMTRTIWIALALVWFSMVPAVRADLVADLRNEAPRPEAEVSGRPPRGGRLRGVASVGGVGVKRTEASPDRSAEATPTSLSEGGGQDERPEKARRIARSSSGHTAGGRGFKK